MQLLFRAQAVCRGGVYPTRYEKPIVSMRAGVNPAPTNANGGMCKLETMKNIKLKLLLMLLLSTVLPESLMARQDPAKLIENVMNRHSQNGFSGVVLVADKGKPVYKKA